MPEKRKCATLKLPHALELDRIVLDVFSELPDEILIRQTAAKFCKDDKKWHIKILLSNPPIEGPQLHKPAG